MKSSNSSDLGATTAACIETAWEQLIDGLMIQRAYLCNADQLPEDQRCPIAGMTWGDLMSDAPTTEELQAAAAVVPSLSCYWAVPLNLDRAWSRQEGAAGDNQPSAPPDYPQLLTDESPTTVGVLRVLHCAAVWWVNYFMRFRFSGVKASDFTPVTEPISPAAWRQMTAYLYLALAYRAAKLGLGSFALLNRIIAQVVADEPQIDSLLRDVDELRAVDLVSCAFPWRGRFTKFQSGTGPGQVE